MAKVSVPPRATIREVAALAEVATSTVSRALSIPGRVNPVTRARILRAVEQLEYQPSSHARALTLGKTGCAALLIPDVTNPFYFDIIRGTQTQLKAAGYTLLLVDTEESPAVERQSLRQLRGAVDGVVLAAARLTDSQLTEAAQTIPLVTINRSTSGVSTVILDTASGMRQVLDHLVSLGHSQIAYVSGPDESWSSRKRWVAVQSAAKRLHVTVVKIGPFTPKVALGAAAADAVLNSGVSACVAFNDLLAIGMLKRFDGRGVSVPGDMSVVGCDDIFGADFCNPPLTTLAASQEEAGRAAVKLLLGQLGDGAAGRGGRGDGDGRDERHGKPDDSRVLLPTHLTMRASTGTRNARVVAS